jgi:hypothetical protein
MSDTATASAAIKAWFQTGDIPTESQFSDFISSYPNLVDNNLLDGINAAVVAVFPATQGTATPLTKAFNIISVNPSNAGGVLLPVGANGKPIYVENGAAGTLSVFPTTGQSINFLASNAAFGIPAGSSAIFRYSSVNGWLVVGGSFVISGSTSMYQAQSTANKSNDTALGVSNTLYPSQNAVKTYVDARTGGSAKRYVAVLNQSGTSAPTMEVLHNSLGVTPTPTRVSAGYYRLSATGLFVDQNTVMLLTGAQSQNGIIILAECASGAPDEVYVKQFSLAGSGVDDARIYVDIRVYP